MTHTVTEFDLTEELKTVDFDEIKNLVDICHQNSASKGFWDVFYSKFAHDPDLVRAFIDQRLLLFVSEVIEGHDENRGGRDITETYYTIDGVLVTPNQDNDTEYPWIDGKGVLYTGPAKPEGFPSELADLIIRAFDFAGGFKVDLAEIIEEKLQYNASRARMHGKKY